MTLTLTSVKHLSVKVSQAFGKVWLSVSPLVFLVSGHHDKRGVQNWSISSITDLKEERRDQILFLNVYFIPVFICSFWFFLGFVCLFVVQLCTVFVSTKQSVCLFSVRISVAGFIISAVAMDFAAHHTSQDVVKVPSLNVTRLIYFSSLFDLIFILFSAFTDSLCDVFHLFFSYKSCIFFKQFDCTTHKCCFVCVWG